MGTSTHTLQRGISELWTGTGPGEGRVRLPGGGRKVSLPQHPEWVEQVKELTGNFKRNGKVVAMGQPKVSIRGTAFRDCNWHKCDAGCIRFIEV